MPLLYDSSLDYCEYYFVVDLLQQYYGLCSLEIGHVKREDAGVYTVTATNPRGNISCSATLDVQSKSLKVNKVVAFALCRAALTAVLVCFWDALQV